jgi:hypothetical protein
MIKIHSDGHENLQIKPESPMLNHYKDMLNQIDKK